MVTIRKAEHRDERAAQCLLSDFYKESVQEFGLSLDSNTMAATIRAFIDNHIAFIAEEDGLLIGVVAGTIANSIFDEKELFAQEAVWYIHKDHRKGSPGIRLLSAFEKECKKRGAKFVGMMHMSNLHAEVMGRLYKAKKYKAMELHYIKEI